jgi:hypothetical protein
MDLGRPVGLVGLLVDTLDLLGEPDLLDVAGAGPPPACKPAVEPRDRDLQDPEDGLDPEAAM